MKYIIVIEAPNGITYTPCMVDGEEGYEDPVQAIEECHQMVGATEKTGFTARDVGGDVFFLPGPAIRLSAFVVREIDDESAEDFFRARPIDDAFQSFVESIDERAEEHNRRVEEERARIRAEIKEEAGVAEGPLDRWN